MRKTNQTQYLLVTLIISVFVVLTYIFHPYGRFTTSKEPRADRVTDITESRADRVTHITEPRADKVTDITDLFLPDGQFYDETAGNIYDCFRPGLYQTALFPGPFRHYNVSTEFETSGEDSVNRAAEFKDIYEKQGWIERQNQGGKMTDKDYRASGEGSTLQAAQAPLTLLNSLIDRLKIFLNKPVITIVDIPCGDFFWMRELIGRRSDVQYTGIDIVAPLIEKHKKEYMSMKNAEFKNLDIVNAGLNQSYDMIFSRDMLQHLRNADVMKVLGHFSRSGSKLLVTSNVLSKSNIELHPKASGRYRPLNLMLPPVNLIPPLCSMRDNVKCEIKELSVWRLPLKQHK